MYVARKSIQRPILLLSSCDFHVQPQELPTLHAFAVNDFCESSEVNKSSEHGTTGHSTNSK